MLSTIIAGATLVADDLVERYPVLEPLQRFAGSGRATGTLGIIAVVVGFMKLFAPVPSPPQALIVGDFLPAAAGMLLGALLIIERYRDRRRLSVDDEEGVAVAGGEDAETNLPEPLIDSESSTIFQFNDALKPYRKVIGISGIAVGVVHFLLAGVLFL